MYLPQLGVRFLAESNSWIANRTPPTLITVRPMLRVLSQLASDNVLAQPNLHCSMGYSKFWNIQIFKFLVCGRILEENIMYQQLQQNNCKRNACRMKVFRANLGKFG